MKTLNSFLMKLGNRQKRAEATPLPAGEDGIRRFPFLFSVTYSDAAEPPALPPAPRARLNRKRSSGLTRGGRRAASSNLPRRSGPYGRAGRPQPETRTRTDGTDLGERAGAAAGKPGHGGEAGALSSAAAAGPLPCRLYRAAAPQRDSDCSPWAGAGTYASHAGLDGPSLSPLSCPLTPREGQRPLLRLAEELQDTLSKGASR